MFSELYDAEYIGTKSEMLRTSFKLCFGLLDKIASSICNLYDLADENENIYFESFWNPRKQSGSSKKNTRWETINSDYNISLLALYTQASDLNRKDGEWAFFKNWRNSLEHNHLALVEDEGKGKNIEYIKNNCSLFYEVDKEYFQEKTLQMIQFTRSAIFNFVFLIRHEFLNKRDDKKGNTKTVQIKFRNDENN
jgi:hypothetical protein